MAETLNVKQIATVMNGIVEQATGKSALAAITAGDFSSVATTALVNGYDPIMNAISQMVGRTIISNRPYQGKFNELVADTQRFGWITRKIVPGILAGETDGAFSLTDGAHTPDMFDVRKRPVRQFNFYGTSAYAYHETYYNDQINGAFDSLEGFRGFVAGMRQAFENDRELMLEALARATFTAFVAGVIGSGAASQTVNLLTDYNTEKGTSLTATTVREPANWSNFVKYATARIQTVSNLMESRSTLYHKSVTGFDVYRHTPVEDQRFYMPASIQAAIGTEVMPGLFNQEWLQRITYRPVDYFQSIQSPMSISVTPTILGADGTTSAGDPVTATNVFAVLMDRDAVGVSLMDESVASAPYEVAGRYTNVWYHANKRYWMDYTENCVVFLIA